MNAVDKIIQVLLEDPTTRTKVKMALEKREEGTPKLHPSLVLKIMCTSVHSSYGLHPEVNDLIRQSFMEVLGEGYKGNIKQFAEDYGINRNTVHKYLKDLGIKKEIARYRGR